jgi:thiol reductant ABC exporter CydD subunit
MRPLDPRLLRRTRAVRPLLAADVALGLCTVVPIVAQAALLARIVATAFAGEPVATRDLVLLALAFAARGALGWAMEVTGRRAAASVMSELRLGVLARRLRAHPLALDGTGSGELAAVAVQGVDALESHFARSLPQLVLAALVPPAIIAWVAALDLESAIVMALTLPFVPVFMWLIGRASAQRAAERGAALRRLSAQFLDVVRGLPTLRAFGRGSEQAARVANAGDAYRRATLSTLRLAFLSGAVLELAATLGVALVAVTAGVRLADGSLGLQTGLTVLVLAPELYLPLRRLGAEYHASADGLAVAERLLELLDAPPEVPARGRAPAPDPAQVPVRLERVSFAYPARAAPVLADLDLELAPGETVALVGASGAGKSTVAALLAGLLAPTSGRVLAGGVDLATCEPAAWRARVAWVPQHPVLLRASVADNLALGAPRASRAQLRAAARLAGADGVIARLPDGYDTIVGDGGRALSPGERRRIAMARALARDAPLLILDEPAADLDPEAVAHVAATIARLGGERTLLVIAHRPELAAGADRVLRLERGAIVPEPLRAAA